MSLRALGVCPLWVVILTASFALPQTEESNPAAPAENPPAESTPAPTASAPSGPSVEEAKKHAQAATSAVDKVEKAVAAGHRDRVAVERYLHEIRNVTTTVASRSTSPLDDLRSIDGAVKALLEPSPDLISPLSTDLEAIKSAEQSRATECSALDPFKGVPPEVATAQAKCSAAQGHVATERPLLEKTISDALRDLGEIYTYVAKQVQAMADKLGDLQKLQPEQPQPAPEALLQSLPRNLPILRQVVIDGADYQLKWERIKLKLERSGINPPEGSPDTGSAKNSVQAAVESILPKLATWFQILADAGRDAAATLGGLISKVEADPALNSAAAIGATREKSDMVAGLQSIVDTWPPVVAYLTDRKPDTFSLKDTKASFEAMQSSLNTLRGALSRLDDAIAGDFSQFETDQVSLYYFTDVKRLMFALNPAVREIGGVAEAQEQATAQRKKLTEYEFELADAQASVNRYQKQVLDLQEQQRQIQAKLKGQDSKVSRLASRLKQAQTEKRKTASEAENASDDPAKVAEAAKAKSKDEAAAKKESEAQSDYDSAKSDRDATQSQLDASKNDSNGLPAKIEEAKQALSGAQTAVSEQRRNMLMAAEAESDAFAFARDNTPFLWAKAVGSSTDPAKRVVLYAFNDSKTIFMRGKQEDLNLVKRIIRQFDRPAPQARLTLWTLQMSAEADQKANSKSAERLNGAMQIIDEELSDTRSRVNTTLTLFRGLVNAEVQRFELGSYGEHTWATLPGRSKTEADEAKWRRAHFYDPAVLRELGIDLTKPDLQKFRELIPDPSSTTTLGEALMVISLARRETRQCIHDLFVTQFPERMKALQPILTGEDDKKREKKRKENFYKETENIQSPLIRIWEALGIVATVAKPACPSADTTCPAKPSFETTSGALSSPQREISRALIAAHQNAELKKAADYLQRWYAETSRIEDRLEELDGLIRKLVHDNPKNQAPGMQDQFSELQSQVSQESPELRRLQLDPKLGDEDKKKLDELGARSDQLNGETRQILAKSPDAVGAYTRYAKEKNQLEARLKNIRADSVPLAQTLMEDYGLAPAFAKDEKGSEFGKLKFQVNLLRTQPLDTASPRQAAADEMLKEMVIAVEDDLDRVFVQPMIVRLRTRLTAQIGVRVGILQRESLLATNRGLARVDPRASAQLAVGEEQDILSGVQQLAQLYTAVQSGGAFAALGALQKQPREPQPDIYALTTGNKFQVTPIFDPSGQALRFKFDFVGSSQLREPNGTTNQQFPRIERHTVNTEVQLTNLETREISRFESNARLGLPTTYWGGFPVLKDIPYVRPWVPLIGWFVRKGGSNASAQQSVIFAQTTIYPTISSLVDLLSEN